MPYRTTQCYVPPDRGDIPALTPAEAGTRLSDPGGMQGWVVLLCLLFNHSCLYKKLTQIGLERPTTLASLYRLTAKRYKMLPILAVVLQVGSSLADGCPLATRSTQITDGCGVGYGHRGIWQLLCFRCMRAITHDDRPKIYHQRQSRTQRSDIQYEMLF